VKKILALLMGIGFSLTLWGAIDDGIQVIPMLPEDQPDYVSLQVAIPEENGIIDSENYFIQVRLKGFSIGTISSDLARKDEVANKGVQSLHIIIDNEPYFVFDDLGIDPLKSNESYLSSLYKIPIPFSLKEGLHTLRIFPARSFGESLKKKENFVQRVFYYKKKEGSTNVFKEPFLTYNQPQGTLIQQDNEPILLDFYVNNVELSQDGYKVKLVIDQKIQRLLSRELPYYIYGLGKGYHEINLSLVDNKGKLVPGVFNQVSRLIKVE
jgi:hypothetical protein